MTSETREQFAIYIKSQAYDIESTENEQLEARSHQRDNNQAISIFHLIVLARATRTEMIVAVPQAYADSFFFFMSFTAASTKQAEKDEKLSCELLF